MLLPESPAAQILFSIFISFCVLYKNYHFQIGFLYPHLDDSPIGAKVVQSFQLCKLRIENKNSLSGFYIRGVKMCYQGNKRKWGKNQKRENDRSPSTNTKTKLDLIRSSQYSLEPCDYRMQIYK